MESNMVFFFRGSHVVFSRMSFSLSSYQPMVWVGGLGPGALTYPYSNPLVDGTYGTYSSIHQSYKAVFPKTVVSPKNGFVYNGKPITPEWSPIKCISCSLIKSLEEHPISSFKGDENPIENTTVFPKNWATPKSSILNGLPLNYKPSIFGVYV